MTNRPDFRPCAACGGLMEKVRGVVSEPREAWTVVGRPAPYVARPAVFWACGGCECCVLVENENATA